MTEEAEEPSVAFLRRVREVRPRDLAGPRFARIEQILAHTGHAAIAAHRERERLDLESSERGYRTTLMEHGVGAELEPVIRTDALKDGLSIVESWLALSPPPVLDSTRVLSLHATFFRGADRVQPGTFRSGPIGFFISTDRPPEASRLPALMDELFEHTDRNPGGLSPVELALQFQVCFNGIHPFKDGNGRVARLATTYLFWKSGLPPLLIQGMRRRGYFDAFGKLFSSKDIAELGRCYAFLAKLYLETLALWFEIPPAPRP